MKKILYTLIIFVSFLSIFGSSSAAYSATPASASISLSTSPTANIGDTVDVVVNADTEGASVNAIDLTVSYDPSLLSFSGYADDNSVIKLWIDPPHAANGTIMLSGIVPGGVSGVYDPNIKGLGLIPLVHLFFVTKSPGTENFYFTSSIVLQNDGLGTPLAHDALGASMLIKNILGNEPIQQVEQPAPEHPVSKTLPVDNSSDPAFWIVVGLIIAGLAVYQLLTYKYDDDDK